MTHVHKYKFNSKAKLKLKIRLNNNHYYFTNLLFHSLIQRGLKQKLFRIFCHVIYFIKISRHIENSPYLSTLDLFKKIFFKLSSKIFLRYQHIGKTKHTIPAISTHSTVRLAIYWFLKALRNRSERTLYLKLSSEIKDVLIGVSPALEEKNSYYKLAFKNKMNVKLLRKIIFNR